MTEFMKPNPFAQIIDFEFVPVPGSLFSADQNRTRNVPIRESVVEL